MSRGIIYVKDFFNNEGKPMTYEEFNTKHGTFLNFIEYYGITKAIPSHVKEKLQNDTFEIEGIGTNYTMFLEKKFNSKYFYNNSIVSPQVLQKITDKWEHIIEMPMSTDELSKSLANIKVITLSTKLRSFYYRLLVHALITNVQLHKWKQIFQISALSAI